MRLFAVIAVSLAAIACAPASPAAPMTEIDADVAYLASRALEGRATGSPGGDSAAVFLARRYDALGLEGVFTDRCASPPCAAAYFQPFEGPDLHGHNIGAVVPGTDGSLRGSYVVIGAHFDHLGRSPQFAADRNQGFTIRPGADDNASGTAAVLSLARHFAVRQARRSIVLVNFDAEELGLIGSGVFVEHLPIEKDSILFMVNLDMIGRFGGRPLFVDGSSAPDWLRALIDSAAHVTGIRTAAETFTAGRSDHASFGRAGIPAIALFTGFHSDYHRVSDVASRVDGAGIGRIVSLVEQAVRIADGRAGASRAEVRP